MPRTREMLTSGEIIFSENISEAAIVAFAQEIREWGGFEELYIRNKRARHVLGLKRECGSVKEVDHFYHKLTDILKRRYGNECHGWSISAPTHFIDVA